MLKPQVSCLAVIVCSLAVAATAQTAPSSARTNELPADVRKLLERIALCNHLGGEYGAVGSPRNTEVSQAVELNRCDSLDQDAKKMKRKYAHRPAVLQALAQAESPRPK